MLVEIILRLIDITFYIIFLSIQLGRKALNQLHFLIYFY